MIRSKESNPVYNSYEVPSHSSSVRVTRRSLRWTTVAVVAGLALAAVLAPRGHAQEHIPPQLSPYQDPNSDHGTLQIVDGFRIATEADEQTSVVTVNENPQNEAEQADLDYAMLVLKDFGLTQYDDRIHIFPRNSQLDPTTPSNLLFLFSLPISEEQPRLVQTTPEECLISKLRLKLIEISAQWLLTFSRLYSILNHWKQTAGHYMIWE